MKRHHNPAALLLLAIAVLISDRISAEMPYADPRSYKPSEFQIKPLQRLGLYGPSETHFLPVKGRVNPEGNVYFVTHGWAPGYLKKVNKIISAGKPPLAWDKNIGFNDGWFEGLCESIKKTDPGATIFFGSSEEFVGGFGFR
jgi:hypothetical protein